MHFIFLYDIQMGEEAGLQYKCTKNLSAIVGTDVLEFVDSI